MLKRRRRAVGRSMTPLPALRRQSRRRRGRQSAIAATVAREFVSRGSDADFHFSNSLCRAAFALAFLSGLLQPAFAVPGGNCGAVDRLTVALRFAQVLFPELKG